MPDQLDPLFDALRGQPPPAPFAPAAAVRRRGRQRTRRQATSAGVVVLAVVGLGAGGVVTVTREPEPAPPPAASAPAPETPGPAPPAVPAGWLLAAGDLPGGAAAGWVRTTNELLSSGLTWYWGDLCGGFLSAAYPSLQRRVDLATVSWENDGRLAYTRVDEVVDLFETPDAAAANLDDVRRVIALCSQDAAREGTVADARYRVVAEDLAGEESLLIEVAQSFFDGETLAADPHLSYAAVVRVGSAVATVVTGDRQVLGEVSLAAAARLG